ncbi:hypothetical protein [Nesterenkonia jeotgali]|uniref:Uncharacterized protein n=1 Tax=Nesterenkonia jeotgali TaxID=317018 RepID=A0A839FR86_9MICC|nr:hypothetical protein [Nesterenkonia jeotgali]MBA8920443.1 hypothetical protein [Nesterenkonia jeotgali]
MSDPAETEAKKPEAGIALRYVGIALCMLAVLNLVVGAVRGDELTMGPWLALFAGIGALGLSYMQKMAAR